MSVPRRKPWEVASGASSASLAEGKPENSVGRSMENDMSATSGGAVPAEVPDRPTSLTSSLSDVPHTSSYGSNSYNSGYGGGGGYGGSYGSGYGGGLGSSMYGGLGSSMYGGGLGSSMYGGYGSMYGMGGYGGYGGYNSMHGMGGYGNGMYGPQGGLAGGLAEGTQATFQLIESIIGAVGGFAQMLEATYMATHSSFFTMVSLAEQFGNLKNALGSLLGIFALIKFVKKIFYKLTGRTYNYGISAREFAKFEKGQKKLEDNLKKQGGRQRISFKPLLLFLAASIGFPYILSKIIQRLSEQQRRRQQILSSNGTPGMINPSEIQFAKALYEFNPENPDMEVELKPNELVAILSKLDPAGRESEWWKVRSRLGKVGYVPLNFLTIIERRPKGEIETRPKSDSDVNSATNQFKGDPNKLSVEEFQKFRS